MEAFKDIKVVIKEVKDNYGLFENISFTKRIW